jgi:hypothetical protein
VSEQPNTEPEEGTEAAPEAEHVVTDREAAVDDALGSTDNPH